MANGGRGVEYGLLLYPFVMLEGKHNLYLFLLKIKSLFGDMLMGPLIQKKLLSPPSQRAVGERKDLAVPVPRQRQKNKQRRRRQSTGKSLRTSSITPSLSPGKRHWPLAVLAWGNDTSFP